MAITAVGESQSFAYTGTTQEFVVPFDGIYKLEAWGASGGYNGAKGGYSLGHIQLKKGTRLYVCCGGVGGAASAQNTTASGGYNGGGSSNLNYGMGEIKRYATGGGGGATHIALVDGVLKDIGYDSFVTNGNGLIVAGGGGGGDYVYWADGDKWSGYGGAGGGMSGANGSSSRGANYVTTKGGTQTGSTGSTVNGGFGYGGSGLLGGGGGGGLYGGGTANGNGRGGGGGGSGYIGGVPEFTYNDVTYTSSTTASGNSGTVGSASITLMVKTASITAYLGVKAIEAMYLGDKAIESLIFG